MDTDQKTDIDELCPTDAAASDEENPAAADHAENERDDAENNREDKAVKTANASRRAGA